MVIAGVGYGGWMLLRSSNLFSELFNDGVTVVESDPGTRLAAGELLPLTTEVPVENIADISNLPAKTPDSFKAYLDSLFVDSDTEDSCGATYKISKLSTTNIAGSTIVSNPESETCELTTPEVETVWYMRSGEWQVLTNFSETLPRCEMLQTAPVYPEFVPTCLSEGEPIPNPVGSISSRR